MSNPQTFPDRDNWMRVMLAADLPHAAVRLAMRIALHLRVYTGQCNPSCATLADETRLSERSIYRLLDLSMPDGSRSRGQSAKATSTRC